MPWSLAVTILKPVWVSTDVVLMGGVKTSSASTVQAARIFGSQNHRTDGRAGRVIAVLSLSGDGLCLLCVCGEERKMSWGMARQLLEAEFDAVTWAELSNGVWVARSLS